METWDKHACLVNIEQYGMLPLNATTRVEDSRDGGSVHYYALLADDDLCFKEFATEMWRALRADDYIRVKAHVTSRVVEIERVSLDVRDDSQEYLSFV